MRQFVNACIVGNIDSYYYYYISCIMLTNNENVRVWVRVIKTRIIFFVILYYVTHHNITLTYNVYKILINTVVAAYLVDSLWVH